MNEGLPGSDAWVSIVCAYHSAGTNKEKLRKKQKVSLKLLRSTVKKKAIELPLGNELRNGLQFKRFEGDIGSSWLPWVRSTRVVVGGFSKKPRTVSTSDLEEVETVRHP